MVELEQPANALRFERLYRLMVFIHGLVLRQGGVPDLLQLDDLLVRQIVEVLAPALLANHSAPDPAASDCAIDELVDWIHAHCHEAISLSDLEERSHYSRRSLQYAFKARFGCGPMQYLRRQRPGWPAAGWRSPGGIAAWAASPAPVATSAWPASAGISSVASG
jgi:hypothetical protein